jgi:hypothetical protein
MGLRCAGRSELPLSVPSAGMSISSRSLVLAVASAIALALSAASAHAQGAYVSGTLADNPLGFWTLATTNGADLANGYTSTYLNGATTTAPGTGVPLAGFPSNAALTLDGNNVTQDYVTTGLSGGISGTGSIVAWVNLAQLPSTAGAYFYIAGESQVGNDFDLQFQNDNSLYFYTGAGENTSYTPNPASLVGQWNQIVVTYAGGASGFRDIYWNGVLVSTYTGSVDASSKTSTFTIGYTPVFGGRDFDGEIDEVAVFGSALTSLQVSQLYSFAAVPEPPAWVLILWGCAAIGWAATRRARGLLRR